MCTSKFGLEIGATHRSWLFPPSEPGFAELLTLAGLLSVRSTQIPWEPHCNTGPDLGGREGLTGSRVMPRLLVQGPHLGESSSTDSKGGSTGWGGEGGRGPRASLTTAPTCCVSTLSLPLQTQPAFEERGRGAGQGHPTPQNSKSQTTVSPMRCHAQSLPGCESQLEAGGRPEWLSLAVSLLSLEGITQLLCSLRARSGSHLSISWIGPSPQQKTFTACVNK